MEIENSAEGYALLWRKLEDTHLLLAGQCRRFCIQNILRSWFPPGNRPREDLSWSDFVWEICMRCDLLGLDELPPLPANPKLHRKLLCAVVQVCLGLCPRQINLKALDAAYSVVFPSWTPLNVRKRKVKS